MSELHAVVVFFAWALQFSFVKGAIGGLAVAAWIDYKAFLSWKKWGDIYEYDWSVASFRWVQGAIVGAATGAGLGA